MPFKSGDRVSIKGFAGPRTVMDIQGDTIGVLEYDPQNNVMRRQTYKADMLQLAPRSRRDAGSLKRKKRRRNPAPFSFKLWRRISRRDHPLGP